MPKFGGDNMKNKKSVFAISTLALALCATAHADLKISGQVNQRAIIGGDLKDDISVADNTMTGTRFRFTGETEGDLKAGFRYEIQMRQNNSAGGGSTTEGEGGFNVEVRHSEGHIKGGFGKVTLGRGEPAASNTADATYGNGNFYSTPNLVWLAYNGAVTDFNNDPGNAGNLIVGGTGARGFDGDSGRTSRIQYDSPNFNGFSFAYSLSNDSGKELGVRYQGKIGPGSLKARYGMGDRSEKAFAGTAEVDKTVFSFLYQLDMGLNFGGSMGSDDRAGQSGNDYDHFAIGWKKGKIGASYEFLEEDNGDEVTSFGATYTVAKGANIYVNMAQFDNNSQASGNNSFDGMMLGLHVKF
jgi:hypothetical protein